MNSRSWWRYLGVIPIIRAVRERQERELRFRLTASHFMAIFVVPAVVLVVAFVVAFVAAFAHGTILPPQAFAGFSIAAVVGSLIFLLPGIVVASILGKRRARDIFQPVSELSHAATALAEGDLARRATVEGKDELAALGRSFNSMAGRLEDTLEREAAERARAEAALAANRELVANVSHELRTPVAVIRSHLEAQSDNPAKAAEYGRIALRETKRLQSLVEDLFALSRLEHATTLARGPFDAASAAREAVASLEEPARREAGVLVRATEQSVLPAWAIGDRERIVQVLQNFIRNAIRFTPEGGIVLVSAKTVGDCVEVVVADTGPGIGPVDLPRVFERFYRADTSRSRGSGGAGLGLAIAKQLVEAMGGAVSVSSRPGEGAEFTVALPAAVPPTA